MLRPESRSRPTSAAPAALYRTAVRTAVLIATCALVVVASGCGDDLQEPPPVERRIGLSDILGEWHLSGHTRELFKRDGHVEKDPAKPYSMTFLGDGWLKFDGVVDDVKGGTPTQCLGRWQIEYDVVVEKKTTPNVVTVQLLRPHDRYVMKLSVTEDQGYPRLWTSYGDGKRPEYQQYERPGSKPKSLLGE